MPVDPLDTMPTPDEPTPPPFRTRYKPSGRDGRGRFRKGCRGGPGNPALSAQNSYAREMRERIDRAAAGVLSETVIAEILASLIDAARGGDVAAAKLVLSYAGVPRDRDAEIRLEELEGGMRETMNAGR